MSTLAEIERAAGSLPREEQRKLVFFLIGQLRKEGRKPGPTGFLKRWGGTMRKIEDPADPRLTRINRKHLR